MQSHHYIKQKLVNEKSILKDERSFKRFLFDWVRDNAVLTMDGKEMSRAEWASLLDNLLVYHAQMEETAHKFKLTYEQCHELIMFLKDMKWQESDGSEVFC